MSGDLPIDVPMDDFVVTSQNPDVEAVRASLADDAPAPTPAEGEDAAAPTDAEAEAAAAGVEPEAAPAAAEAVRDATGKFAKRKPSLQDRLNHTTWEREEARREAARLQAELEALRRDPTGPPSGPPAAPAAPVTPTGKPDLADFDTHEEWADALVAWHLAERDKRDEALARQHLEVQARQTYAQREDAFAASTPGYREAMERVSKVPISASLRDAILTSERGPALAFYLATHPEDATGLIQQTWNLPTEAAPLVRQLLEAKLPAVPASTGSGTGTRHHSVPPPISPVGASPVVADPVPIDELPPDEYVEAANAREFAERKKRFTLRA